MAEITPDEIRKLCNVFLPAFNQEHRSNFTLDQVPEGSFADFFIRDGHQRIPVQHVKGMENPRDDVVIPRNADEFLDRLWLVLQEYSLRGLFLSLSVKDLPRDPKDLAYRFADFISAQVNQPPAHFRLDVRRDLEDLGLREILNHVPSIEIFPIEGDAVFIGCDCADVPTTPHLDDQQVLEKTVEHKRRKYGHGLPGTVLLVEAWPRPFCRFYLHKARVDRGGATSGFREIWVVSVSGSESIATRIA